MYVGRQTHSIKTPLTFSLSIKILSHADYSCEPKYVPQFGPGKVQNFVISHIIFYKLKLKLTGMRRILARVNAVWNQATTSPAANETNKSSEKVSFKCWFVLDACCDCCTALRTNHHRWIGPKSCLLHNHRCS
jgi:hypothetical protein